MEHFACRARISPDCPGDAGTTRLPLRETRIGSFANGKGEKRATAVSRTSFQRACSTCEHSGERSLWIALDRSWGGALLQARWCKPCSQRPICGHSARSSIDEYEVPMHRISLSVSFLLLGVLACRGQMVRGDSLEDSGATADPSSSPSDVAIRTSIEQALVKNRFVEP